MKVTELIEKLERLAEVNSNAEVNISIPESGFDRIKENGENHGTVWYEVVLEDDEIRDAFESGLALIHLGHETMT